MIFLGAMLYTPRLVWRFGSLIHPQRSLHGWVKIILKNGWILFHAPDWIHVGCASCRAPSICAALQPFWIDPRAQARIPSLHFARLQLSFPKSLLGYRASIHAIDSRTRLLQNSLRQGDIPDEFLDANAAHLCPLDYLSHSLLPAVLRQAEFTSVTLDPSPGYMNPTFWGDVPALLTGLTAFLPSEEEIRSLFHTRSTDLWEMAEALTAYGCEIIVIKRGERGQYLFDAATRSRWEIPAYPARYTNPIGVGHAFCGGFLAGYRRSYDSLEAVLYGNISASLVLEGHTGLYALDVLPGLPEARLEALRQSARKL